MGSISRRTVLRGMAGAAALAALPDLTSALPAAAATGPGQKGLVGATVFTSTYPGSADRIAAGNTFDNFVLRPMCTKVQRVYYPLSTFPAPNDQQDPGKLASNGIKMVISLHPDPAGGDVSNLDKALTFLQNIPNIKFEIALWHEANNDTTVFKDSTTYHDYVAHYAPTVRAHGVTLVYIPLIIPQEPAATNALTYYPGPSLADKILADFYGSSFVNGARLEAIMAKADAAPMPFGIAEWGNSLVKDSPIDPTDFGSYVAYIVTLMTGRLAAGKANAEIMYYNAGGSDNNITAKDDFRVPGVDIIFDSLTA